MKRRHFLRSSLLGSAFLALPAAPLLAADPAVRRRPSLRPRPRHGFPDVPAVTGDGRAITLRGADLEALDQALRGPILLAGDEGYDESRLILNPSFDRHPAVVIRPAGPTDVRHAVDFARDHGGVLLAVKCGGHSFSGKSTCDGGIQLDLSGFRGARVDAARRRALVAGGSLLGLVDHETLASGLATPLGTVSHTGVGGLVTGGGFGRLARRYGLSIDNLVSVDVVTADGRLLHANAQENPDLFWGVRGGGGNFGVVTSFEFALHPFERELVAGELVWPMDRARDVFTVFGEYGPSAPDELQIDPFMVYPPGGAPGMVGFNLCWSGPESGAEAALAPLRRLGPTMADSVARTDYQVLQRSGDTSDPRAQGQYLKGGFIREMTPELVEVLATAFEPHPERATVLFIQQGGGAIGRVDPAATAFAQRDVLGNLVALVGWPFGEDPTQHIDWCRSFWERVEPSTAGFYVNDLVPDHTTADIAATYERNAARLVEVKNRYDPQNLFRMNANIVPTA
jgi:FAD/FMN-containing dehydrogenase